jgi:hypothetical protein
MERIRILVPLRRALLLNGHDIDIIPKDVLSELTFVPAHWTPTVVAN